MLKLNEPFRYQEIFIFQFFLFLFFSIVQIWVESKLHIFADPDPGKQNLVDSTVPDPKH